MSFSDNVKRKRLESNMTQERLAAELGVSAQAVSKWETSDTYPDGALLAPLAKVLNTSLDELFDSSAASMADISGRIIALLHNTDADERFNVARDICWQLERGLFDCSSASEGKYDPDELRLQKNSSYILSDSGFTLISNGREPFFSIFPQPKEGYGYFLENKDRLMKLFEALSHETTMRALVYLYRRRAGYTFEGEVLARDCELTPEERDAVLEELRLLRVIWKQGLTINGEERTLYHSEPSHKLIALLLVAQEIDYRGAYCLQSSSRSNALLFSE